MKSPPYIKVYPNAPDLDRDTIPEAVTEAITKGWSDPESVFAALCYDGLNGCYCIEWAGMYVGIENDGYTHT